MLPKDGIHSLAIDDMKELTDSKTLNLIGSRAKNLVLKFSVSRFSKLESLDNLNHAYFLV